jgi:hypothetical protein
MNFMRTIESLIRQCFNRYPVPMTAWQIGRIIRRNPASVSSRLHRMYQAKRVIAFLGDRLQILYAPLTLNTFVQACYSFTGDTTPYNTEEYRRAMRWKLRGVEPPKL